MALNKALALTVNRISFLKDSEKELLAGVLSGPKDILGLSLFDFAGICGRKFRTTKWDAWKLLKQAEEDYRSLEKGEFELLLSGTAEYPALLSEIYDPPFVLYVRGDVSVLHRKAAGIVGTREPQPKAEKAAFKWGLALGCEDICTVSGLARGVDTAAHKGALSIGGKTAAVLGSAVDRIYPRSNIVLARSILENGGAIVSEFPPGTEAAKYHFPKRNRIISGLSGAVVLVQAPAKSGALITADYALEQGREVYIDANCAVLPGNEGCLALLESGAGAVAGPSEMHFTETDSRRIRELSRQEKENGGECAQIMERELTDRLFRYRNSFFDNDYNVKKNGGQIAG